MEEERSEEYMQGFRNGLAAGRGYAHARVMKVFMYVQQELEDIAKMGSDND